jgi:hypothetical protein
MQIDCDECAMQNTAAIEVDEDQAGALEILAEHGLAPPLRLVPRVVNE